MRHCLQVRIKVVITCITVNGVHVLCMHLFLYIYIYQPASFCAYRSALCVCVSDSFAGPVSAKGQCTVPAYPSAV